MSITHPLTKKEFRSISAIVEGTQSQPWLPAWASRLAVRETLTDLGNLLKITVDDGRMAALDAALLAAGEARDRSKKIGLHIHDVFYALVRWRMAGASGPFAEPQLPAELDGEDIDGAPIGVFVQAVIVGFQQFVRDHDAVFLAADLPVFHSRMRVAGNLDVIAHLRKTDRIVGLDVTTGKQFRAAPEKLSALRRSDRCHVGDAMKPTPGMDAAGVLQFRPITVKEAEDAEKAGKTAPGYTLTVFTIDEDKAAWRRFRAAATLFGLRQGLPEHPGLVTLPPLEDGTQPPVPLEKLRRSGYGGAIAPLIKDGCVDTSDAQQRYESGRRIPGIGDKTYPHFEKLVADYGRQKIAA